MKKFVLALTASAVIALSLIGLAMPKTVIADGAKIKEGSVYYTENEDGTLSVSGYDHETTETKIVIPSEVKGKKVTEISENAFQGVEGEEGLEEIVIPDTVTSIGESAFKSSTITSIEIPASVTTMGSHVFMFCDKLESIKLNNSPECIGDFMFAYCSSLKSISIPDSVKTINDFAFFTCSSLESVKCGKSLTTIKYRAFDDCVALKNIEFNSKLESIEYWSFLSCKSLEKLVIPASDIVIGNYPFQGCLGLKSIKIEGDIEKCGRYAFGYTGLEEFEITGSIGLLGECAFCGLPDLKSIKFGGNIDKIDYDAFAGCISLEELILPKSITSIDSAAFGGCINLKYIELGGPLDLRSGSTFAGCYSLKKVVFTDGLTRIGNGTFANCDSLEEIVVPDSLEEIEVSAFYGSYDSDVLTFIMTCSCQNKAAFDYSVNEYASAKANLNLIHEFGKPTIVPSTCSTEGYEIAVCQCGAVDKTTYSKDSNNHENIVVDKAVAPVINHSGLTEGSHCEACKTVIVAQEVIPALTPTPTATPVPTANPTVEVTPTEEVKPTATPTPVVTTEPTTAPVVTPTEEVTPVPTNKPTEEPAITPTATVAPSVTAEPTAEPTVTPAEESGVAGFSERLYTTCLGRDSEAAGKDYWTKELKSGKTGAEVARGFFFSDELIKQNLSDEEFITRLYKTFMDREPEAEGMKYWLEVIKDENGRAIVFDGFVNSQEWANICLKYGIRSGGLATPSFEKEASAEVKGFAERLYTTCLGRESEEAGLEYWAQELANLRKTGTEAALGFFFSDEFVGQNVSDKEFVTRLYKTFMNREPEKGGFDYWMDSLKNGASREQVFYGFATAPEFGDLCGDAGIIA